MPRPQPPRIAFPASAPIPGDTATPILSATVEESGLYIVPAIVDHISIIAVFPAANESVEAVKSYSRTPSDASSTQSTMFWSAATASELVRFGVKFFSFGDPLDRKSTHLNYNH